MNEEPEITNAQILDAVLSIGEQVAEVKAEVAAIRDVVDNELASHGQVVEIEGQMQQVLRTQRQHTKKLERLDLAKT